MCAPAVDDTDARIAFVLRLAQKRCELFARVVRIESMKVEITLNGKISVLETRQVALVSVTRGALDTLAGGEGRGAPPP